MAIPVISNEDSSWDELSEAEEKSIQIVKAEVERKVMEAMRKCGALVPEEINQDLAHASPLAKQLLEVPFPSKFKIPQLESYDGTLNPQSHLAKFCTLMHLHTSQEALLCKVFPTTLKDIAQ